MTTLKSSPVLLSVAGSASILILILLLNTVLGPDSFIVVKLDVAHLVLIGIVTVLATLQLAVSNQKPSQSTTNNNVQIQSKPKKPTPASSKANAEPPKLPDHNPYASLKEPLVQALIENADLVNHPADGKEWVSVVTQKSSKTAFVVEVHRKVGKEFFFRVVAEMEGTPEEVFDYLSDIHVRHTWDDLCEEGGVAQVLAADSKIQYMHTKGMFPAAARDALVVSFLKKLDDGRYLNVTKSVDSAPGYVPRASSVRMQAHLAGLIVGPADGAKPGERKSKVVQIMDGDLGGWLPKSLVAMITTQAMPLSLRRVNNLLRDKPNHRSSSELIEQVEGKRPLDFPSSQSNGAAAETNGAASEEGAANGHAGGVQAPKKKKLELVVGGVDLGPAIEKTGEVLVVAQPWLVAGIFLSVLFGRRRR
ncbi:Collagen type IV alpha-3-binding protein [Phlyctochytrium planicorne]|nr:Collagen type IV alpha-3-binding protein [Phlyctochytrium planicorne]